MMSHDAQYSSPVFHRDMWRMMHRQWMPHLTPVAYAVVEMVFDRTVGWGKQWEEITYDQFTEGVWTRGGACVHPGVGYGRKAVNVALKSLIDCSLLFRNIDGRGTYRYAINFKWTPPMEIKLPKRFQNQPQNPQPEQGQYPRDTTTVSLGNQQQYPRETQIGEKKGANDRGQTSAPSAEQAGTGAAPAPTPVQSKPPSAVRLAIGNEIATIEARSADRRAARLTKTAAASRDDIASCWRAAFQETFVDSPFAPLKVKDIGALRGYMKRWNTVNDASIPFMAYLDWCVRHWRAVLETELRWMSQPSVYPSPLFFVKFGEYFERAFASKSVMETRLSMTTHQRMVADLTERGYTPEAATEEADNKLGLTKQRMQIESEKEEVERQRRLLQLEEEQVKRMRARFATPVQPAQTAVHAVPVVPVDEIDFNDMPTHFGDYDAQ